MPSIDSISIKGSSGHFTSLPAIRYNRAMNSDLNSAEDALQRFSTKEAAEKYNKALIGTKKHEREMAALSKALDYIPNGSSVLDFPCGTGRLYPKLFAKGFDIIAVDSSWHMASIARANRADQSTSQESQEGFAVSDILKTAFADSAFDAVVCNRLFHHFFEPEIRRTAFYELHRIARKSVVVSYYSTRCIDSYIFKLKNKLRGRNPTDRVPIAPEVFAADAAASGLKVVAEFASRSIISMQTYAVLEAR
jgi:SAM-dependent methyltransferase